MDNATRLGALVDEVVLTRMLLQMEAIEETGDKNNIEEYDALSEAISFIASPQRLEEMSAREVAKRWNEVIVNA